MKQTISVSNSSSNKLTVVLEPIAEEKILQKGELLQIVVAFTKETTSPQDVLEFNYSERRMTIFYTAAAVADWVAR
jgi:hypothetical protein